MLKKTVKFTDFNGTERTEDVYFHISRTAVLTAPDSEYNEIIQIANDLQERGKFLQDIQNEPQSEAELNDPLSKKNLLVAESVRMLARLIDKLIDFSYGRKSDDGSRFIKSKEVLSDFKGSAAYDALVEQLITNQDEMVEFVNQLLSSAK